MINAIFAVEYSGGLGLEGKLPWPRLPEDMKYFQEQTKGGVVVMGRRTWDSLPPSVRPLPDRVNIVVTNNPRSVPTRTISGDIQKEILKLRETFGKTVWIIGGKEILEICRTMCNNLYITHVKGNYRSDVRINMRDFLIGFRATSACPSQDRTCNFMTYKNILPYDEGIPRYSATNT